MDFINNKKWNVKIVQLLTYISYIQAGFPNIQTSTVNKHCSVITMEFLQLIVELLHTIYNI